MGNMWAAYGLMNNYAANGQDPFSYVSAPAQSVTDWASSADKVDTNTASWSDPGSWQGMSGYSSWIAAPTRSAYSGAEPTYSRLSDGDYARLEDSLKTAGEVSAKQAYDTTWGDLRETMSGNGLYGSSIMAKNAEQNVFQPYIDALTTNAATAANNRYAFQQSDNQYASDLANSIFQTRVGENTSLNQMSLDEALGRNNFNLSSDQMKLNEILGRNQYNLDRSNSQNNYNLDSSKLNMLGTEYNNSLLQSSSDDAWKRAAWNQTGQDTVWDRQNQWWSYVNPLEDESMMNSTANAAASRDDSGMDWGSLAGGLGSLAGSFFGGSGSGLMDWFGSGSSMGSAGSGWDALVGA